MAQDETNFKCPVTGEEFIIPQFRTMHKGGERVYKDKYNKVLVNPANDEPLEYIDKPFDGYPSLGKFSMLSKEQKQDSLRKRSLNHSKTNGELKSRKEEMEQKFVQDVQNMSNK